MDITTKMELIARRPTEEIITESELKSLLETRSRPRAYNGFELRGPANLGTGLVCLLKAKDMVEAGCEFVVFLADWHSWVNGNFEGNLERIRRCGEYFKEVWSSLGMGEDKVEFVYGYEMYNPEYWRKVLLIAKHMTLDRTKRTLTIAGRAEDVGADLSMYFYPPMQVADVFHLGVDICQMGLDQRRANTLAREVGQRIGVGKPVCVHHHVLMGLGGPRRIGGYDDDSRLSGQIASRMKSEKESILVHDSPEKIRKKIIGAFCPPKNPENPIMEIVRYILVRGDETPFSVTTKLEGEVTFDNYSGLEKAYVSGKIHPLDLKNSVSNALIRELEPCRTRFKSADQWRDIFVMGSQNP